MEIWDILDEQGNKTGKTIQKGEMIPEGYYHMGADIWIIDSKNNILIQKRSPQKKQSPNVWAMTGGSVIKGETTLETIERETFEELRIKLNMKNIKLVNHYKTGRVWIDSYLIKQEVDIKDIVMQEEEVSDVKWATYEEIEELNSNEKFLHNRWDYVKNVINSISYIGKELEVNVDRPLGSSHPQYLDHIYKTNYGFIPNTISGDGEEIDCYILGEDKPIKKYKGKCIAVIHRLNDNEDKLIIAPNNKKYTEKEIKEITNFQEKYFKSVIIM